MKAPLRGTSQTSRSSESKVRHRVCETDGRLSFLSLKFNLGRWSWHFYFKVQLPSASSSRWSTSSPLLLRIVIFFLANFPSWFYCAAFASVLPLLACLHSGQQEVLEEDTLRRPGPRSIEPAAEASPTAYTQNLLSRGFSLVYTAFISVSVWQQCLGFFPWWLLGKGLQHLHDRVTDECWLTEDRQTTAKWQK